MRQLLFVLFLLASLPVAHVQAEPYGLYDPATGDIVIDGLRGQLSATLRSTSGQLRPDILTAAAVISPTNAEPPLVLNGSTTLPRFAITWHMLWKPHTQVEPRSRLGFDSIFLDAAVPLGTSLNDLTLIVDDGFRSHVSKLSLVPEPAALAVGGLGLFGLAVCRRRFLRHDRKRRGGG